MALHTGQQIIAIHILPNISGSKGNRNTKFVQLIKCNVTNIFFRNYAENETGRLVPGLFLLFFLNFVFKVKTSGQHINFNIFW